MRTVHDMRANPTLADVAVLADMVIELATDADAALMSLRFHDTLTARDLLEIAVTRAKTVYPPDMGGHHAA